MINSFVMDMDKNPAAAANALARAAEEGGEVQMAPVGLSTLSAAVPVEGTEKAKRRKCNDLSAFMKWAIVARYYEESNRKSDRLYHGSLTELCDEFSVSKRTIQRIVNEYKTQIEAGHKVPDMSNKKCGRSLDAKYAQEVSENIKKLKTKAKGRLTVRGMAEAYETEFGSKISYMTLYRYDKRQGAKGGKALKFAKPTQSSSSGATSAAEYAATFEGGNEYGAPPYQMPFAGNTFAGGMPLSQLGQQPLMALPVSMPFAQPNQGMMMPQGQQLLQQAQAQQYQQMLQQQAQQQAQLAQQQNSSSYQH